MSSIVRDPIYRYWNTNQQCPYIKCEGLDTDYLNFRIWTASGITLQSGQIDFDTIFNISPNLLSNANTVGELTIYFKNDGENLVHMLMLIVTKVNSVLGSPLNYQSVGNMTPVIVTIPNNNTVRIQADQGAECKWIWRGI